MNDDDYTFVKLNEEKHHHCLLQIKTPPKYITTQINTLLIIAYTNILAISNTL